MAGEIFIVGLALGGLAILSLILTAIVVSRAREVTSSLLGRANARLSTGHKAANVRLVFDKY